MLSANFLKKEKMRFGTLINVSLVMICFLKKAGIGTLGIDS
ncbi:hypothetical protein LEP1GSC110_3668 [Leptospira interrogans serovar Medanensis str. UT053]|nr:hypothetical protein LEP1GSC085_1547 [Leptospira interrogans str. L0996]EMN95744.1 hypothetical protein LEP1GSC110_3668 [Leptospira interrogans serovar Medanensis str. UT053]